MPERTSNRVGRDVEREVQAANRERHERGRDAARSQSRRAASDTAKEHHAEKPGAKKPSGVSRTAKRVAIGSDATHRTVHGRADIALSPRRSRPAS